MKKTNYAVKPNCSICGEPYHGMSPEDYHGANWIARRNCKICGTDVVMHVTVHEEIGSVVCDRCWELESTLDYFVNKYGITPDLEDVKRFMK